MSPIGAGYARDLRCSRAWPAPTGFTSGALAVDANRPACRAKLAAVFLDDGAVAALVRPTPASENDQSTL